MNHNEFVKKYGATIEHLTKEYPALMAALLTGIESHTEFGIVLMVLATDSETAQVLALEVRKDILNGGEFKKFVEMIEFGENSDPEPQKEEELPRNIQDFLDEITK